MKNVRFALALLSLIAGNFRLPAATAPAAPMVSGRPPPSTDKVEPAEIAALRAKADRGNAIAQYNLGLAYAQGRQVPLDLSEAFIWLSIASETGSTGRALETLLGSMNAEQINEGRRRLEALRA